MSEYILFVVLAISDLLMVIQWYHPLREGEQKGIVDWCIDSLELQSDES